MSATTQVPEALPSEPGACLPDARPADLDELLEAVVCWRPVRPSALRRIVR